MADNGTSEFAQKFQLIAVRCAENERGKKKGGKDLWPGEGLRTFCFLKERVSSESCTSADLEGCQGPLVGK